MIALIVPALLWLVNFLLLVKTSTTNKSPKAFECGFENHHWVPVNHSLQFFKMGLVFVLFDLELMFILGMFYTHNWVMYLIIMLFIWSTLWMEYSMKSLSWSI